jgi:hypothetical protein
MNKGLITARNVSEGSFGAALLVLCQDLNLGVVDLAKGPAVKGSLARSTTTNQTFHLDGSLVLKSLKLRGVMTLLRPTSGLH